VWPGARSPRVAAPVAAALAAVAVVYVGVRHGALVVGGSDSYGYVSQAHSWATGNLRVEPLLIREPPGGIPPDALVPLGYRLGLDRASAAPMYAPGLPMVMALFERAGGANAVFYVMPVLAGVAVWATYVLGTMVAGKAAGVMAALLLATSPAFVFQLTHAPMSDIPATAWWAVVLVLIPRSSRASALLAGLAAGAAILTRPNLVPLAIVPGALLLWNVAAKRPARDLAVKRLLLFAAGSIPCCIALAYLNHYWYGSPFESGYGPLAGTFYRWEHFRPNLTRYARWLVDSQSPVVLLAIAAPLLWTSRRFTNGESRTRSIVWMCAGFAVVVYLCYAFYLPFDAWWFLRFLLPAFPNVFVLMSAAILRIAAVVPARGRGVLVVAIVALLVAHGIRFGRSHSAFDSGGEWRFATAGRFIAQELPRNAVFFAMQHSGSATYYAGRPTVRYDHVPPAQLDLVVEQLQVLGFSSFILLDDWEEPLFTARFSADSRLGALDWPPVMTLPGVNIYRAPGAGFRAPSSDAEPGNRFQATEPVRAPARP
jgi:4-amino-4-deoxy-L-arabinose transferase-like glycosyltransferase